MRPTLFDGNRLKAFFIITKDRPRYLQAVLSELHTEKSKESEPLVFILDSSSRYSTNEDVLSSLNLSIGNRVILLPMQELIGGISRLYPETMKAIGSTSAPIARYRNVALLVASAFEITEACFLDDDVSRFSKAKPYKEFFRKSSTSIGSQITGVQIRGVDSRDYMTKLTTAFYNLTRSKENCKELSWDQLMTVKSNSSEDLKSWKDNNKTRVEHVSGGFACCSLDFNKMLPFPAVYNEFWIWCFLQSHIFRVPVKLSRSWIFHKPPPVRDATMDTIVKEQTGIFFYKLLRTLQYRLTCIRDLVGPPIIPSDIHFLSPYNRVSKILAALTEANVDCFKKACKVVGIGKKEIDDKLMVYLQSIDSIVLAEKLWRMYTQQVEAFLDILYAMKYSRNDMVEFCLSFMDSDNQNP